MEIESKKTLNILKDIKLPFFGSIFGVFLFIEEVNSKKIVLKLILPSSFDEFLKELLIFEINQKLRKKFEEIEVKINFFSSLDDFYSFFQHNL